MRSSILLPFAILLVACGNDVTPESLRGADGDLAAATLCGSAEAKDTEACTAAAKVTACTLAPPEEASIAICTRVMDDLPVGRQRDEVQAERSEMYRLNGHPQQAIADADAVIARQPEWPRPWRVRGQGHLDEFRNEEALADIEQALKLAPDNAYLAYLHAVALSRNRRYHEALAELDRAIPMLHGSGNQLAAAHGLRCETRADLNVELAEALEDCAIHMRSAASDPEALINSRMFRGLVYFRLGRHADAIADFEAALGTDRRGAAAYFMRGLARRALGQTARGDADVARALHMHPYIAERFAVYVPK
jgi:tetratricopeptide (TPR) repeat protein